MSDVCLNNDGGENFSPNKWSPQETIAHTFVFFSLCFVLHCYSQDRDCCSSSQSSPRYTYHGQLLPNKETKLLPWQHGPDMVVSGCFREKLRLKLATDAK
uniref:PPUP7346 n=1 Tax=Poeciliopsis prolifica TaxID=188132 RepID=A0A0S7EZQ1_9TELE